MTHDGSRIHEERVDFDPFASGVLVDRAPSTEAQREIFASASMAGEASAAYNETLHIHLRGTIDIAAMRSAVRDVLARHDALRSSFEPDGLSFVVADSPAELVVVELEPDRTLEALIRSHADAPFDLIHGPLVRVLLCHVGPEDHHLLFTAHHAVCDGWSSVIVLQELAEVYRAAIEGRAPVLDRAPRYVDYARARADELSSAAYAEDAQFWTTLYRVPPSPMELPRSKPRPALRTYAAERIDYLLDAGLVISLQQVARKSGATLLAALVASFEGFLARVARTDDPVLGISSAGQAFHGVPALVGHCVNLLPLRTSPRFDAPFIEEVRRVRGALLDAQDHQRFAFGALVASLGMTRDPSRIPLVPVVFNLDVPSPPVSFGENVEATVRSVPRRYETFELFINAVHEGGGLRFETTFNADLYERSEIERLLNGYTEFLTQLTQRPEAPMSEHSITPPEDRALIAEWNATARTYPEHRSLHALVEEQVARTPDATAVVFGKDRLSYRELDAAANRLARRLSELGVGPDVPVGVCLERSLDLVVALLAVLKAGGAYVALDPDYPLARLEGMLEDSKPKLVLSHTELRDRAPGGATVLYLDAEREEIAERSDEPLESDVTLDHAAYVIFTSGSTGRPKGVVNTHRGICNRLLWMQEAFDLTPEDRVLQKTPYSFDVSVWEFFWPLIAGATLVVAKPGGHREPEYLVELISDAGITTIHFVPSMLQAFLSAEVETCTTLRRIICSGEALSAELTRRTFERLPWSELHNLYGPTEAAVDVTWWPCRPGASESTVPIGRPIANTQIHILDAHGQPTPIGVPGELHIGGVQVARGYVGRPDLTAERFIPDPFGGAGARLYRTGDLAYWRTDGAIEYLGRLDHQVKVHGLRIELGEIEAVLESLPQVRQAVVTVRGEADDRRLVAYVVYRAGVRPSTEEIRSQLGTRLPQYMVPGLVIPMDALPLTASGKVDRKALPDPIEELAKTDRAYEAPVGPVEEAIAAVWKDLLGVERVGRHDDFFELGGHSLLAIRMSARLRAVGREDDARSSLGSMTNRLVFEAPTVRALAERLEALRLIAEPLSFSELKSESGEDLVF